MSSYYYINNFRSSDLSQLTKHPSEEDFKIPEEFREKKDSLRRWYQKQGTDHCFLTLIEPLVPTQRCTVDNPPHKVHGWVADFDAAVDWSTVEERLLKKSKGHPPTWYAKTRSDGLRLIWEFQKPITVDDNSAEPFLRQLAKDLNANLLHAGYDRTSTNPCQYFEIGENWVKLGDPLPESFVFHSHVRGFKTAGSNGSTGLPFKKAREEILRRFSSRLVSGVFEIGTRVPLFWLDDGIDRIGGQVCEEGIICYSDRASSPFINWAEILGSGFVKKFKESQLHEAIGNVWTDGKYYWVLGDSRARHETTDNFTRRLIGMGMKTERKKGQQLSEVGEALNWVNTQHRVDGVGPFLFSDERLINIGGKDILNTAFLKPVEPATEGDPEHWPFLANFLNNFFEDIDEPFTQKDVFFSWFQRFYRAALYKIKLSGQVLIISGPTGRGKTLLSYRVVGDAVGGHSSASEYLMGKTAFNKALSESPLWTVDDTTSACSFADNRKFTEMLKRAAANPTVEAHAKYIDSQDVEWVGRVMLSLNEDANSLSVVPQLDQSNIDKIIGLRVSDDAPTNFGGDNHYIESTIQKELPYFLRWVLDYTPPKELVGEPRYGIKPWFHTTLRNAARDNSPIKVVMETVDLFCKLYRESHPDKTMWLGTVAELLGEMSVMPEITTRNGTIEHERMDRQLRSMEEARGLANDDQMREIKSVSTGRGTMWLINLSKEFDLTIKGGQESSEHPQKV